MFLFSKLLVLFSLILTLAESCEDFAVAVSQKIENEGFHREIHWLVETWGNKISDCKACLRLVVPSGLYVNPDQIYNLNQFGQVSAYVQGTVDVEKPAHESNEHIVYVHLPHDVDRAVIKLPIHLRYHKAALGGGYAKVVLPRPALLVHCVESDARLCNTLLTMVAPCDVLGRDTCEWNNVSYQALFNDVEFAVPIGNLDDYPIVSIATLLLGCVATIYILSILSNSPL